MSKFVDCVLFAVNVLFVSEENKLALVSLRNERFEIVVKHAEGKLLSWGCIISGKKV